MPSADNGEEHQTATEQHEAPAMTMPLRLPDTPVETARQTRSGRVIKNTPRYAQSMSLRDQGLVVWELLIDQDEQEVHPMAATQFATQKALDDPIAFAATNNPDILYWDQAMNDRIPSTTPGAEPPRDAKDSGSARSHSTHLETSSSDRP